MFSILIALVVCVQSQLITSEFGVDYKKVLQCDGGSGDLNLTIQTHIQSANLQQQWPPLERREGKSLISLEYLNSASENISASVSFFDIQCEDIQDNYSSKLTFKLKLSPLQQYVNQQYVVQQVIDQESIGSGAVVAEGGRVLACCNLVPEFPEFPPEFTVTIEANMADKGYSLFQTEHYSSIKNLLRVDTYTAAGNKIIIQDFKQQNQSTLMLANTTYPNGLCEYGKISQTTAVNTLTLLFLEDDIRSRAKFVYQKNPVVVRGVPCEQWSYRLDGNGNNSMGINGNYTVDIYFGFASWYVARTHEHRQLMRVQVTGTSYTTGKTVDHFYEYVDFIPSLREDVFFERCKIIPLGEDCDCSLAEKQGLSQVSLEQEEGPEERMTAAGVACLFPFIYKNVVHNDCVKIGKREVCPDEKGVWQECILLQPTNNQSLEVVAASVPLSDSLAPVPQSSQQHDKRKNFTSSQSGNYVICGIIGLIVGAAITWMTTYIMIQKRRSPKLPNYQQYEANETELTNREVETQKI